MRDNHALQLSHDCILQLKIKDKCQVMKKKYHTDLIYGILMNKDVYKAVNIHFIFFNISMQGAFISLYSLYSLYFVTFEVVSSLK